MKKNTNILLWRHYYWILTRPTYDYNCSGQLDFEMISKDFLYIFPCENSNPHCRNTFRRESWFEFFQIFNNYNFSGHLVFETIFKDSLYIFPCENSNSHCGNTLPPRIMIWIISNLQYLQWFHTRFVFLVNWFLGFLSIYLNVKIEPPSPFWPHIISWKHDLYKLESTLP